MTSKVILKKSLTIFSIFIFNSLICTDNPKSLSDALYSNDIEAIRKALQNGAKSMINYREDKFSPLELQILNFDRTKNSLEICKILVEAGADVNANDKLGWTPLMRAANGRHLHVCQLLITAGSEVNKPGCLGLTPLMVAGGYDVIKYLIDAGADVTKKNTDGKSALENAQCCDKETFNRIKANILKALAEKENELLEKLDNLISNFNSNICF